METATAARWLPIGAVVGAALGLGLVVTGRPFFAAVCLIVFLAVAAAVSHLTVMELTEAHRRVTQAEKRGRAELIADMGQQLRTPLNAILGYTELMKRSSNLSSRQLEGLGTVERSGLKLLESVNELLDLARLESGRFELHPEPIRLRDLLQDVAEDARARGALAGLAFVLEDEDGLPPAVRVDSYRLRQLLQTLLDQIIVGAESGRLALRVRHDRLDAETVRLMFQLRNDQPGEESAEPLMEPVLAHRLQEGGVSLRVAFELARAMGTELSVSRLGALDAWQFSVMLPLASVQPAPASSALQVTGYEGPRRRILVVDDVEMYRFMLSEILGGLGFDIDEAANGQECLDRVAQQPPDLIILDLVMPVMDGMEALSTIRMQPTWAAIPVAVISASVSEHERMASQSAGAQAWLVKPVNAGDLLEVVANLLDLRWQTAGGVQEDASPEAVPPIEQIEFLRQLALEGNMRKVRHFAEDLEMLDERFRPLAERLKRLAGEYHSQAILELAEHYRNQA